MTYTENLPLWNVTLTHDEVQAAANAADLVALGVPNPITAAIAAGLDWWRFIDRIGGNNGISLTGVFGQPGILTVPGNVPVYGRLVAVLGQLPAGVPALIGAIVTCNPMLGLIGWIQIVTNHWPFGADKGEVHVDEDGFGDDESLSMIHNDDGTVSFLTHVGYLRANNDFGQVDGLGTDITDSEKWFLEQHPHYAVLLPNQNMVALKSKRSGKYLTNWRDNDNVVHANWDVALEWQEFLLEYSPDGRCALRSFQNDQRTEVQYLSVAD